MITSKLALYAFKKSLNTSFDIVAMYDGKSFLAQCHKLQNSKNSSLQIRSHTGEAKSKYHTVMTWKAITNWLWDIMLKKEKC